MHGAISRPNKIKRHKSFSIYYPNTVAAFNVELIGDLAFKLNPGPSLDGTIPVVRDFYGKLLTANRKMSRDHDLAVTFAICSSRLNSRKDFQR